MFRPLPNPFARARPGTPDPAADAAGGTDAPFVTPHVARRLLRRQAMYDRATLDAAHVPAPGEAVHLLLDGRYDLMHLIGALAGRVGPVGHLRIATLSLNKRNLAEITRLADAGTVARVSLVCSFYFTTADTAVWAAVRDAFAARGWRAAAPRCHAKVVTLDGPAHRLSLEGSANLRTNRNFEQLMVCHDPGLHDWHACWIDAAIDRHENDQSRDGPAG
ncbi:MAG: hypothetical protein U0804_02770 [Gemmataceae bacterium]